MARRCPGRGSNPHASKAAAFKAAVYTCSTTRAQRTTFRWLWRDLNDAQLNGNWLTHVAASIKQPIFSLHYAVDNLTGRCRWARRRAPCRRRTRQICLSMPRMSTKRPRAAKRPSTGQVTKPATDPSHHNRSTRTRETQTDLGGLLFLPDCGPVRRSRRRVSPLNWTDRPAPNGSSVQSSAWLRHGEFRVSSTAQQPTRAAMLTASCVLLFTAGRVLPASTVFQRSVRTVSTHAERGYWLDRAG